TPPSDLAQSAEAEKDVDRGSLIPCGSSVLYATPTVMSNAIRGTTLPLQAGTSGARRGC
ncbi:unnamed protein product, partial [Musa acuminata var. zebrina]